MESTAQIDVVDVFTSNEVDLESLLNAKDLVLSSGKDREKLSSTVSDWDDVKKSFSRKTDADVKHGFALWVLGREREAVDTLSGVKSSEAGAYLYSFCLAKSGRKKEAIEVLNKAVDKFKNVHLDLFYAEMLLETGDLDQCEKLLKKLEKKAGSLTEYGYLKGFYAELTGEYDEAVEHYRKVLEEDENHSKAAFRLAFNLDRMGKDEEAVSLYKKLCEIPPVYKSVLINLGILYEDMGEFQKARECFQTVLEVYPHDRRARLFLGDAEASMNMIVHEELEREADKRNQTLKTPVTDFELSVRSRNCLNKMNIATLGDLIKKTEAELLSYKNFGETSLAEIKAMLNAKGLRLGMGQDEEDSVPAPPVMNVSDEEDKDEFLSKSINSLELSVRSRSCMDRLGIQTIGDLVAKSETELLEAKNFGQTSLNEVKRKLSEFGITLGES